MKNVLLLVVTAFFLNSFFSLNAQYTGPGAEGKTYTVEEIKANASSLDKSDAIVQLKGFVVEQINKEDYWFKDSTGKILVEIEKDALPAGTFDDKTEVVIIGEVDYDVLEGVEIEVDEVRFLSQ